jgi:ADP-ribose pyrophosphatase YjhB (NUDIX family)
MVFCYDETMVNPLDTYKFCPNCRAELELKTIDNDLVRACSACGFIYWNNPKPVTSILLHKHNQVLMLQRAKEPLKGYWVLPGGFIKYEETVEEAVKRETKEETNLDVSVDSLIGVYRIDNDPRGVHLDVIFGGKPRGSIKLNMENSKYQYFDFDKLPQKIAYKHSYAIDDWRKNINSTSIQ